MKPHISPPSGASRFTVVAIRPDERRAKDGKQSGHRRDVGSALAPTGGLVARDHDRARRSSPSISEIDRLEPSELGRRSKIDDGNRGVDGVSCSPAGGAIALKLVLSWTWLRGIP